MTNSTDRTGWAKARIPLNWSEEHPVEDGEWTECVPPNTEDDSLGLDDDKIREARKTPRTWPRCVASSEGVNCPTDTNAHTGQ